MKKKLKLGKTKLKNLKLALKKTSDRKAAPLFYESPVMAPSNGSSC